MQTYEQRWERRNRKLQERLALIPAQLSSDTHILPERPAAPVGEQQDTPVTQEIGNRIYDQARRAAKSALVLWCNGQFDRQRGLYDDLLQDLLEWYLETPSTQNKMESLVDAEVFVTFKIRAQQILSRQQLENNVHKDKVMYSVDSIKRYLKGESTNRYLIEAMPYALGKINEKHKEAVISRYVDGKVPEQGKDAEFLSNSLRTLTQMVNLMQITTDEDVIGSRGTVFPESVKPKSTHGDPTANICMTLMGQHPDFADEYTYESPWEQICTGAVSEPVIEFGPSGRYRLTAEEAKLFRRVPGLVELFIEQKQKEWA